MQRAYCRRHPSSPTSFPSLSGPVFSPSTAFSLPALLFSIDPKQFKNALFLGNSFALRLPHPSHNAVQVSGTYRREEQSRSMSCSSSRAANVLSVAMGIPARPKSCILGLSKRKLRTRISGDHRSIYSSAPSRAQAPGLLKTKRPSLPISGTSGSSMSSSPRSLLPTMRIQCSEASWEVFFTQSQYPGSRRSRSLVSNHYHHHHHPQQQAHARNRQAASHRSFSAKACSDSSIGVVSEGVRYCSQKEALLQQSLLGSPPCIVIDSAHRGKKSFAKAQSRSKDISLTTASGQHLFASKSTIGHYYHAASSRIPAASSSGIVSRNDSSSAIWFCSCIHHIDRSVARRFLHSTRSRPSSFPRGGTVAASGLTDREMGALVAELRQKTLVKAPVPQLWAAYTNVVRGLALPTLQSEDIVGLFQALAKSLQFEEAMEMMLQAALDVNDMGKQLPQAAFDILMRQAISELPADQIKATLWQIQGRRRFITEFIQLCDSNIEMKMFLGLYNQLNKASFDVDGFSTYFQSRKERAEKLSDMILQWINEDGRKVNIKVVENLMVFLLDRGVTDKVFATISALHKEGFSFNHGFFTSAIHRFGKERKFDYMEMSLELMRRQGLEPLEDTYAAVIDAHSKAGNLKEAQRAYQDALAAEFTPTDQVFGPMVEAVGRMGDYKMTRQLVHQMNSSGVPSNVYTFSSLLQSLAQDSDRSTQLFEEISKTVTPNTVNYNLLIRTFQRLGDLDGAFRVFRSMVKDGVRPDRYTFSSILNLFAVRGDSEGAETFWNEMVNVHNIVPNAHAYGSMMHVYCTTEDMLSAQAVYREMIQVGILPNEVIFGTLMNAYARRGDLTQMLSIYDAMRAEGLKPNSYIYSNLLFGLVQDGDMVAARHLYENMEEDGFGHNVLAQTILIKGYLDQGDIQESQQIYQNMLRSGLVPNFMTYAILLQAHVRRGEKKEGRKFLNKIMKSRGLVVVNDEDESLYDDGVDKLRMDQSHDRVGPSFPMITDGNEFSGRVEDGHLTLMGTERKPLKFASRPKPLMAFAPLLDAYAKEGNILAVEGMFEEIKARGLEPNTVIYTMLMDGYRRAGNVNAVLRIWGEIFGRFRLQWEDTQQHPENYRPLKDTTFVESVQDRLSTKGFKLQRLMQRPVSIILDSLSYSGRVLEAKTMWRQLEEMGFQFDSSNWNDYCIALTRNGRLMEACEVLRDKLLPGFKSNLPGAVQARARKPHSTSRRDIARSNFERNRLSPLQSIKEEEEEEERINSRPSTMFYPRPRTFAALADVLEDLLSLKGSSRTRSQDQLSNPVEKPLSGDSKISGYATTLGGSFSVRNRRLEKRRRLIDAQLETYPRPFAKLDENQRHILWNMVRSEYPTVIDALEEGILVAHESTNAASNSTGSTLPASGFDEMDAEKKKATAAAAASAKSSLNAEGKVETDTPVYRGFRQWRQLKFVMKDMQRKQFLDDHRTFNKERAGQFTRQRGHKPK